MKKRNRIRKLKSYEELFVFACIVDVDHMEVKEVYLLNAPVLMDHLGSADIYQDLSVFFDRKRSESYSEYEKDNEEIAKLNAGIRHEKN